jgi:hypothetical protein
MFHYNRPAVNSAVFVQRAAGSLLQQGNVLFLAAAMNLLQIQQTDVS